MTENISDKNTNNEFDFFKKLHKLEGTNQTIVINELTNVVGILKILEIYDIEVYKYLKNHPCRYIPEIYAIKEDDGKLYVIEEYIDGITLDKWLETPDLTNYRKKQILKEILLGIEFLHKAKPQIIHRDIKAKNIMLTKDENVKIIDYDAARIYNPNLTKDTVLMGTPGNAAPEQYGFSQSDVRTDIYAIGVLINQMFPDYNRYKHIVKVCCSVDKDRRYKKVSTVINVLNLPNVAGESQFFTHLFPPPGFRSDNIVHGIFALFFYCFHFVFTMLCLAYAAEKRNFSLFIFFLLALTLLNILFDILTDYTGIFHNCMFRNTSYESKLNMFLFIMFYVVLTIVILIIMICIYAIFFL